MKAINVEPSMIGLSFHTRRAYRRWLRLYLHVKSLDNLRIEMVISKLNVVSLNAFLGNLKARNLGKQSIVQAKSAVVWLARLIADAGHVGHDVPAALSVVKAPRAETGQRIGIWLSQAEARRLLQSVMQQESPAPARTVRDMAILILMVTCGLRRDEIVTANWNDLIRQGGQNVLRVHGKGEKMRVVKLPDAAARAIDDWRQYHPMNEGAHPIFTRIRHNDTVTALEITDRMIWNLVRAAAVKAGLPRISPHDLRRTFARGAYEAGAPLELIRQALGHANIATTEHYVNSALVLDRAATDIWSDALEAIK